MISDSPGSIDPRHPVVEWLRRELLPLIVERWSPEHVIVFDPPDRPANAGQAPPGLLIVSARFALSPVAERVAEVRQALGAHCPVRPLCLTPGEFARAAGVPGPVLAAARAGRELL